ncbi:MAG: helix-turn-helix domain-containing protein [Balneolaceae bacterium]|nr:helix-turn-helix domain-containing protein [Balneolaceae bacterium]
MRSMFTLKEVAEMLDMSVSEVESEIDNGYLSYSFENGKKRVTLYDLEKYMGAEQTRKITQDYLSTEEN